MNAAARLASPDISLTDRTLGRELLRQLREWGEAAVIAVHQCALDDLTARYGVFDGGAQRTVFRDEAAGAVYKVAIPGGSGWADMRACIQAQYDELRAYELDYECIPVAPCRMVWHESGAPIIIMELLTRVQHETRGRDEDGLPWWAWSVDQMQIGWSQLLGGWAAYDAGLKPMACHARMREEYEGIEAA